MMIGPLPARRELGKEFFLAGSFFGREFFWQRVLAA
jgi:hypothetical protein